MSIFSSEGCQEGGPVWWYLEDRKTKTAAIYMGLNIYFIGFYVIEVAQYFICFYNFELSNGLQPGESRGRKRVEREERE